MGNTQDKYFKLLGMLNDCRDKLSATYNLFCASLQQGKDNKARLFEIYQQLLDYRDEIVIAGSKRASGKNNRILSEIDKLYAEYNDILDQIEHGIDAPEACRKTYKREVGLCCNTYKQLLEKEGGMASKGYKQQVKLIRAILGKIDEIKVKYIEIQKEVKIKSVDFNNLFTNVNKQVG